MLFFAGLNDDALKLQIDQGQGQYMQWQYADQAANIIAKVVSSPRILLQVYVRAQVIAREHKTRSNKATSAINARIRVKI